MTLEELKELLNLPLELQVKIFSRGLLSGEIQTRKPRGSQIFLTIREYRFGDPLRALDFRGSARKNRWLIREWERYSHLRLGLWLDTTPSMGYTPPSSKFSLLKLFAGVLGAKALSRNHRIYLRSAGGDPLSFHSSTQIPLYLDSLITLKPQEEWKDGNPFPPGLDLLYLLSDFMDPGQLPLLERFLFHLASSQVELRFLQILHPDEVDFGFPGDHFFLFSDLEAPSLKKRLSPVKIRDRYLRRIEDHWLKIRALAFKHSVRFYRWVMGKEDPFTALRFLFFG
jgi:hypothetical protein